MTLQMETASEDDTRLWPAGSEGDDGELVGDERLQGDVGQVAQDRDGRQAMERC